MAKTSVIHIGGQDREACINIYALTFLGEALGCDPLVCAVEINKIAAIKPYRALGLIVYAALCGALEAKAVFIHDITLPKVMEWIGNPEPTDTYDTIWQMFKDALEIPSASEQQVKDYEDMLRSKGVDIDELKKKINPLPIKKRSSTRSVK